MELSLINAGIAAGVGLAALPVILHLFMRPTPKRVIFPALRLIRERQKRSKKRLKVKNWLLLAARMLLLALMALALARPSIMAEKLIGDQEVPTAIGLVFDTSLSMGYTQQDKTRLDEGKAQAYDILKKTPTSSVVYVVDSAPEPAVSALPRRRQETGRGPDPPRRQPDPQRGGRTDLHGARGGRQTEARGLRFDRPRPIGLGQRPPRRGAREGGEDQGRGQDLRFESDPE